jgi:hypothetical protein
VKVNLRRFLVELPTAKALIPAMLAAATGVLSGTLVTEITTPAGLAWSQVYKTYSLYGLLLLTMVQVAYSRLIYETERDILRFSDSEFCVAYLRSKCLPEMAARYQEIIRTGEGGEFKRAMDEIREVLK